MGKLLIMLKLMVVASQTKLADGLTISIHMCMSMVLANFGLQKIYIYGIGKLWITKNMYIYSIGKLWITKIYMYGIGKLWITKNTHLWYWQTLDNQKIYIYGIGYPKIVLLPRTVLEPWYSLHPRQARATG
jgi:hypothetical protein